MEPSRMQRRRHNHILLWKLGEVSLGLCCQRAWDFTVPNWSCKQRRKIAKANALAYVGATKPAWRPPIYPLIDRCYIPHMGGPVKASRRRGGYLSSDDSELLSCAV